MRISQSFIGFLFYGPRVVSALSWAYFCPRKTSRSKATNDLKCFSPELRGQNPSMKVPRAVFGYCLRYSSTIEVSRASLKATVRSLGPNLANKAFRDSDGNLRMTPSLPGLFRRFGPSFPEPDVSFALGMGCGGCGVIFSPSHAPQLWTLVLESLHTFDNQNQQLCRF